MLIKHLLILFPPKMFFIFIFIPLYLYM